MAQAITAASTPIVTRLYSPASIGVISIYLSFFNFWLALIALRYENALLITTDEAESHHLFRLGAVLTVVMAALAVPILASLSYVDFLGFGILPPWAPSIVFFSLLGYGWFTLYRSWLLRLRNVWVISRAAVARATANSGTRVIAGAMGLGLCGLFSAEIVGSWFALITVRKKVSEMLVEAPPKWDLGKLKQTARRYKKYAQYEMPSVAINQLAIALPVPIVGALYGAEEAGWFALARLLYAIPNGQIGKAAGDVFQMELGTRVRAGQLEKGERLFYAFSLRLAVIGLAPLGISVTLAPALVPYLFGNGWEMMGEIIARMGPWMYVALVVSSLSRALSVLEKQQWKLIYDACALAVVFVTFMAAKMGDMNVMSFITFLAWGMTVSYIVYFFLIASAFRRLRRNAVASTTEIEN